MAAPYPDDFLSALLDTIHYVQRARSSTTSSARDNNRDDVLDSLENRLSHMLSVLIATPSATSFSFFRPPLADEPSSRPLEPHPHFA